MKVDDVPPSRSMLRGRQHGQYYMRKPNGFASFEPIDGSYRLEQVLGGPLWRSHFSTIMPEHTAEQALSRSRTIDIAAW